MRAYEERIVVEDLRAGRLVVGVVEADERVAQERGELAASFSELFGGVRGFHHFGEVGLHLRFSVVIVVDAGGPLIALAVFEDGLRHLKFVKLLRERER